jgi:hypothetical protein
MSWLFSTMESPEFWKALVGFATAGGIQLAPDQVNAIVSVGLALMGAINAFKHFTRP